jgi:hypothetical protein
VPVVCMGRVGGRRERERGTGGGGGGVAFPLDNLLVPVFIPCPHRVSSTLLLVLRFVDVLTLRHNHTPCPPRRFVEVCHRLNTGAATATKAWTLWQRSSQYLCKDDLGDLAPWFACVLYIAGASGLPLLASSFVLCLRSAPATRVVAPKRRTDPSPDRTTIFLWPIGRRVGSRVTVPN